MERFLAFHYDYEDPGGGMHDFLSDHPRLDEAIAAVTDAADKRVNGWVVRFQDTAGHVWDSEVGAIVWDSFDL